MPISYLSLGSNLGDRQANLEACYDVLQQLGMVILKKSGIYATAPWGVTDQAEFLNQVLMIDTDFTPESLVHICKEAEKQIGRIDSFKWGPRVIDIDVLLYEDNVINKPQCTIPHHLMEKRKFVLAPLFEIAPTVMHPVLNKSIESLLRECDDNSKVEKIA